MYVVRLKLFILLWIGREIVADKTCAERVVGTSRICVCNTTYCDTFNREVPQEGQFIQYTTSKAGSRFNKAYGDIVIIEHNKFSVEIEREMRVDIKSLSIIANSSYKSLLWLKPSRIYQTIEGFGGAVTDSAGLNWKSLPPVMQQSMIESYYGKNGIEFNMFRVPNGSTDFSTRRWAYNSEPVNDTKFTNFTLSYEDIEYKIPFIHKILNIAVEQVKVVTSTWSPPLWMLQVNGPSGIMSVKKEFYPAFADYHCKFAELYKNNGINIWAMSPINEPLIAIMAGVKNESTGWIGPHLAKFWTNHFGPTMRNCSVQGIKILGVEDQRFTIPFWFNELAKTEKTITDYIDGVAVHFYTDSNTAPAVMKRSLKDYPEKFIISTEACIVLHGKKLALGSWDNAKEYANDIFEDLNYDLVGWVDWNLCLNEEGGPNWMNNFVDSPIIVNAEKEEFYKQPMFYILGHFSKFLPRGSQRIKAVKFTPGHSNEIDFQDIEAMGQEFFDHVVFLTPRGTVVVVVYNDGPSQKIAVQLGNQLITAVLEANSISTLEFLHTHKILN